MLVSVFLSSMTISSLLFQDAAPVYSMTVLTSKSYETHVVFINTQAQFDKVMHHNIFNSPSFNSDSLEIDFSKHVVILVNTGLTLNCDKILTQYSKVFRDALYIEIKPRTYVTGEGLDKSYPFKMFVFNKDNIKTVHIRVTDTFNGTPKIHCGSCKIGGRKLLVDTTPDR